MCAPPLGRSRARPVASARLWLPVEVAAVALPLVSALTRPLHTRQAHTVADIRAVFDEWRTTFGKAYSQGEQVRCRDFSWAPYWETGS